MFKLTNNILCFCYLALKFLIRVIKELIEIYVSNIYAYNIFSTHFNNRTCGILSSQAASMKLS